MASQISALGCQPPPAEGGLGADNLKIFGKQIQRPGGTLGQVMKGEPRASKKEQECYRALPLSPLAQVESLESVPGGALGNRRCWEPGMARGERNVLCGE